ncbi:hypothetical protein yinte0001_12140 [Yersinia intermedia ATCC 29909]|nr:hypothetical protein yinte0001_12140 [Yersinia intermedia ATCC 29909]
MTLILNITRRWCGIGISNERNNIERIGIGELLSFGVNYLYRLDIDC